MLAHVLVHAARSASRRSCRWACDAVMIVRRGGVDWPRVVESAIAAGAARQVRAQLSWLREVLAPDVPQRVLEELAARSRLTWHSLFRA